MGIKNLSKLLQKIAPNSISNFEYKTFNNSVIGIDASNILYQYIAALRSKGEDLQTKDGKITTHIYAILYRTIDLLKKGITPIYVFDGKSSDIKNVTLDARHEIKSKADKKLKEILKEEKQVIEEYEKKIKTLKKDEDHIKITEELLDKQKEIKLKKGNMMKQTVSINKDIIKDCKEILDLFNVKYIEAIEEADTQLAYMTKNNLVDYVISEDMDLLTFGCTNLIRNYSGKKDIKLIKLEDILDESNLTYEQFVELCILLGCDYIETIPGIGFNKAYTLIKKHGSIEEILKNNLKLKPSDNFLNNYKNIVKYFMKPKHNTMSVNEWNNLKKPHNYKDIDKEKLIDLLTNKYEFDYEICNKLLNYKNKSNKLIKRQTQDLFLD
jgi:flap endonuclease-1